jgi:hypothetical protein
MLVFLGQNLAKFQPENNDFDVHKGFFIEKKKPKFARFQRKKSKFAEFLS